MAEITIAERINISADLFYKATRIVHPSRTPPKGYAGPTDMEGREIVFEDWRKDHGYDAAVEEIHRVKQLLKAQRALDKKVQEASFHLGKITAIFEEFMKPKPKQTQLFKEDKDE